tara:strand:+ start:1201 stop:1701 length:501 start_codon:yes stop_codon:yes gene_type:complete
MKKLITLIILPFILFSQENNLESNYYNAKKSNVNYYGCQDLDETLIDIVSIFGDTSFLEPILSGPLSCGGFIPTLESGLLGFLPFEIPLDCNTDLTPYGYLDVNLYDICQCSCEPYVNLSGLSILVNAPSQLLKSIDILGRDNFNNSITLELYENGEVVKKMKINR